MDQYHSSLLSTQICNLFTTIHSQQFFSILTLIQHCFFHVFLKIFILMCSACHKQTNQPTPGWWLKQPTFCFLTYLKAGSERSRSWQCWILLWPLLLAGVGSPLRPPLVLVMMPIKVLPPMQSHEESETHPMDAGPNKSVHNSLSHECLCSVKRCL